jgi:mono/diheme cytochrome c family protein
MATQRRLVISGLLLAAGLGAVALWLSAQQVAASGMDAGDTGKVALGKTNSAAHCASCHGADLEGQPNWRQRRANGRLPAPPQDETGHTWHHPPDQLFALTKFGPAALAGGGYQSDMPGFGGTLSDDEIWAVLSFIKSRWPQHIRERYDTMGQH